MKRRTSYSDEKGLPIWAPRVSKKSIAELYHTDARGIRDPDLIDEVGIALLARCESILTVSAATRGKYECPECLATWEQPPGNRKILKCDACGWAISWDQFKATYQHKQLSAGGARSFFEEFVAEYPRAGKPGHKMILIDTLIHRFHSELEKDEPPTRPAAVNLIQGKMKDVISFLNNLTYGEDSTQGTRQTLSSWRDKWNNSYFMEEKQRNSPEAMDLEMLTEPEEKSMRKRYG